MARRPRGTVVNRRHVARLERERVQTNYVTIVSIAIVAIVVVLVISGLVYDRVIVANQPVAMVNGQEITTRAFQARVKYERNNLVNQYLSTAQTAQAFGTDAQFIGFFQNSLNQIELQLTPDLLGRDVLNTLVEDLIIRQQAAEMGITVSEEEVQEALEEFFGYFGGEQPPTPTGVPTTRPTSTLTAMQMTLTAPTATPALTTTDTITDTAAFTTTPEAMPTDEAPAETDATPTATVAPPTPTPYTEEAFQQEYKDSLNYLSERLGFSENDLRNLIESQLFREKVMEAISANVESEQDQVWARHILVETEATANEVLSRLEAGEDFPSLAAEYSTDSSNASNGGDLGWFGVGKMDPEFEKVAFNTPVGQISDPVQSTFGWHVIQVLGHELRPLSASELQQARQSTFEEWLSQERQKLDPNIELFDYWADRVPTEPTVQHIDLQSILLPGGVSLTPEVNPTAQP